MRMFVAHIYFTICSFSALTQNWPNLLGESGCSSPPTPCLPACIGVVYPFQSRMYLYLGMGVQPWPALSSGEHIGQSGLCLKPCSESLTPSVVGRFVENAQVKWVDPTNTSESGIRRGGYSGVLWVAAFHPILIYPVLVPMGLAPYHMVQTTSFKWKCPSLFSTVQLALTPVAAQRFS